MILGELLLCFVQLQLLSYIIWRAVNINTLTWYPHGESPRAVIGGIAPPPVYEVFFYPPGPPPKFLTNITILGLRLYYSSPTTKRYGHFLTLKRFHLSCFTRLKDANRAFSHYFNGPLKSFSQLIYHNSQAFAWQPEGMIIYACYLDSTCKTPFVFQIRVVLSFWG